jgi:hypothetical protein
MASLAGMATLAYPSSYDDPATPRNDTGDPFTVVSSASPRRQKKKRTRREPREKTPDLPSAESTPLTPSTGRIRSVRSVASTETTDAESEGLMDRVRTALQSPSTQGRERLLSRVREAMQSPVGANAEGSALLQRTPSDADSLNEIFGEISRLRKR